MRTHVLLGLLVSTFAVAACLQPLDTTASSGSPITPPPQSDAGLSTVILRGAAPFEFFEPDGAIATSGDPCDATRAQARAILTRYCADCHGGRTPGERAGNPPFDFVLDTVKLSSTYTLNTTPPMLFVQPGDPQHSRLYVRLRHGEMPPPDQVQLPRPTVSDVSVLHQWISKCVGTKPPVMDAGNAIDSGRDAGTTGGAGGGAGAG